MSDGSRASKDLGHGPCLTTQEFDRQIVALHSGLPSHLSKEEEIKLRRRELDLTIDYRLGRNFPQQRRAALWNIQQQVEKKRLRLIFFWLFRFISYKWLYDRANKIGGYLVNEYAKVLTNDELHAYFDLKESEPQKLPIEKL